MPALYSGTNAEFTKADTVIFRTDLFNLNSGRREYGFKRTIKYDSHMLDKPDFVGSYEIGDHVYFFFREVAAEYMNCGKAVYSRVARVCKKDTGSKNILHQNWATYLKARLNCSIPGEFPYYFNEIWLRLSSPPPAFHHHHHRLSWRSAVSKQQQHELHQGAGTPDHPLPHQQLRRV